MKSILFLVPRLTFRDIKRIDFMRLGAVLWTKEGKPIAFHYPGIKRAELEEVNKLSLDMSELPIQLLRRKIILHDFDVSFEKPVKCEVVEGTLRCPVEK